MELFSAKKKKKSKIFLYWTLVPTVISFHTWILNKFFGEFAYEFGRAAHLHSNHKFTGIRGWWSVHRNFFFVVAFQCNSDDGTRNNWMNWKTRNVIAWIWTEKLMIYNTCNCFSKWNKTIDKQQLKIETENNYENCLDGAAFFLSNSYFALATSIISL